MGLNSPTSSGTYSGTVAESHVTGLVSDLALKAPIASPTFTGSVTTPTLLRPPVALTSSAGTVPAINWQSGNTFNVTLTSGVNTVTFSNIPAATTDQIIKVRWIQPSSGAAATLSFSGTTIDLGSNGGVVTTYAPTATNSYVDEWTFENASTSRLRAAIAATGFGA